MEIGFLAVIVVLLTAFFASAVTLFLRGRSFLREIEAFLTPEGEKESAASRLYGVLVKRLATELKVTIMGQMGGEAKGQVFQGQAIMQQMVEEANPIAGALLEAFPSLKKTFRKNPVLLNYAMSKIASVSQGQGGSLGPGNKASGFEANAGRYS